MITVDPGPGALDTLGDRYFAAVVRSVRRATGIGRTQAERLVRGSHLYRESPCCLPALMHVYRPEDAAALILQAARPPQGPLTPQAPDDRLRADESFGAG